mmetsp:Transcript_102995/g.322252  ORF Transcript_102995/g.322252 Transcript_102995/m.322252 type:complete len:546 (-) Transcript_102995:22-1659(-)
MHAGRSGRLAPPSRLHVREENAGDHRREDASRRGAPAEGGGEGGADVPEAEVAEGHGGALQTVGVVLGAAGPAHVSRALGLVHGPVEPEHVARVVAPQRDGQDVASREGLPLGLNPAVLGDEGRRGGVAEVLRLGLAVFVSEGGVDAHASPLGQRDLNNLAILDVFAFDLQELPAGGMELGRHGDGLCGGHLGVVPVVELGEAVAVRVDVAADPVANALTLRTPTVARRALADVVAQHVAPVRQLARVRREGGRPAVRLPQVHLEAALRRVVCVRLAPDRLHAPRALGVAVARADARAGGVAAVLVHLHGVERRVHTAAQGAHVHVEAELLPQQPEQEVLLPAGVEQVQARALGERDGALGHGHAVGLGIIDVLLVRALAAVFGAAVSAGLELIIMEPTPVRVDRQAEHLLRAAGGVARLHGEGQRLLLLRGGLLLVQPQKTRKVRALLASTCAAQEDRRRRQPHESRHGGRHGGGAAAARRGGGLRPELGLACGSERNGLLHLVRLLLLRVARLLAHHPRPRPSSTAWDGIPAPLRQQPWAESA